MNAAEEETWEDEFKPAAPPAKPRCRPNDVLIDIDSRYAGKIIGKNGVTIRELKQKSGAFISVIDSEMYNMKTVKISGSQEAKTRAEKLVQDLIDSCHRVNRQEEEAPIEMVEEVANDMSDLSLYNMNWQEIRKQHNENLKNKLAALPKIVKNFYKEHPEVTKMSDQQVVDFRLSKNNIMVKYTDENNNLSIPKPVVNFAHAFEDYPEIMNEIQKQKFQTPSPVQCQAWPIIMSGHDLIAIAQTGTGKTLAFLLPAFLHIESQSTPREQRKGPTVLVLAPTRELVVQIESEVFIFIK